MVFLCGIYSCVAVVVVFVIVIVIIVVNIGGALVIIVIEKYMKHISVLSFYSIFIIASAQNLRNRTFPINIP